MGSFHSNSWLPEKCTQTTQNYQKLLTTQAVETQSHVSIAVTSWDSKFTFKKFCFSKHHLPEIGRNTSNKLRSIKLSVVQWYVIAQKEETFRSQNSGDNIDLEDLAEDGYLSKTKHLLGYKIGQIKKSQEKWCQVVSRLCRLGKLYFSFFFYRFSFISFTLS